MYLSGVVIPDLDDDENVVIASADYEQVYLPQQYGDDGILDGAEGFGVMQSKALKAKLTRGRAGRRRLGGLGRRGFLFVGGSPSGLGVAPGVVLAAASTAKRIFKKPSPRVFGGPLVSTVNDHKARVERGDLTAITNMDNARKTAKDKGAWQRIWSEMLPTWAYTPAGYTMIKRLDPGFRGPTPAPAGAVSPQPYVGPTLLPSPTPTGTPAPVTATPTDATGAPAPVVIYQTPSVSPIPGGAAPTASEQVATASQDQGVEVQQAGMFSGLTQNPTALLMIGGLVLAVVSAFGQGGGRSSPRRRRR